MFVELVMLVLFLSILAKCASVVVENAEKLALFFGISTMAIGMLLVAVSTSLPELAVSVASASAKEGSIAAGNVFGSNIANILLILGLAAFLYSFRVPKENVQDIALVLAATSIISVYILFHSEITGSALGFVEGVLLLLTFLWYSNRMLQRQRKHSKHLPKQKMSRQEGLRSFLLFGVGILGVILSSHFVVESAVKLAEIAGLAKSFIGATIIAIGTSLPEISIDLQAIRRRQYGLAIGDAIGSNMANLTLVLGSAAAISPIVVQLNIFVAALLFAVVANFVFIYFTISNPAFSRKEGAALLLLYIIYLITIFYLQVSEIT
ncbi:MAG: sodium:calcium antiporter [Candidatus Micrarchaeota archaeon]|nr:sodium:calcium antiporter [Candidatus Micrarchaeota archaeon]